MRFKLGVLASHPIQYQAPILRELAKRFDLKVYFAQRQSAKGQADAGFGVEFDWDIDLLEGYDSSFLENTASKPDVNRYSGCNTPGIFDEIQREKFDAFFVMGWYLKSFLQAVSACRRLSVPVMVRGDSQLRMSSNIMKRGVKKILFPMFLRRFDAFLYVGERNKKYLRYYGVPTEKLYFSPHCIDTDWFAERCSREHFSGKKALLKNLPKNQKKILFVGKFISKKRPLDVVEALAIIARKTTCPPCCAVFVGAGELEDEIREKAAKLGVRVIFMGFLNQSQLPTIYAAADMIVLPSEGSETWGLVVNEAIACGTPAVVSDSCGCAPDLTGAGKAGVSFPCGNVFKLSVAIESVLDNAPTIDELSKLSHEYSVPSAVNGIENAVKALVKFSK